MGIADGAVMKSLSFVTCLGLAASFTGLTGCATDGEGGEDTAALAGDPEVLPVFLDQGWDASTRDAFYRTTQGSRMLPYSWFLALEQADSVQKFRNPQHMRSMGFLVDGPSATNPDELPIGFVKDEHATRGAAIGLTCSACHTGELEFEGTKIRIDGGQSFGDLETLQVRLLASLTATLNESKKFQRFGDRVLGTSASSSARTALRAELTTMRDWWTGRVARSKGITPHGPTRVDAFTIIGNEVVCKMLNIPENCRPSIAPTQFPFLWNTPDFEWAQYNSSVHSPLGRNVGEVTGVYAEQSLTSTGGVLSTANIPNLHALEGWLKSLRSPAWPEEIFGEIDVAQAERGEAIYATACASCHTEDPQPRTAPNAYGVTFAKVDFSTPLQVLGTDPTAAMTFATRTAKPGIWAAALGVPATADVPAVSLLSISGSQIIGRFFAVAGLSNYQKLVYLSFRESRSATIAQLTTYKARPLNGIAFTAPFLHNGSVPSMYELLLPPAQRTKQFHVGSKEFDPTDLGFSTAPAVGSVLLDTTALGNGNGGHVYGTDLDDADRMAVIEYLKTL